MSEPINDGGPAFPVPMFTREADGQPMSATEYGLGGMSLRDWFAGQALAGLLASPETNMPFDVAAPLAYRHADAMLKARGGAK